ncbi:hypothetical protein B0H17DRAFT_1091362 [Mycena rosella]|uniref:Uncharacterized protein n=1 Tax=Mycena rosella TaxID=1033263 RepID=A0AAD7G6M3_MYCRO|nr:hypothetical protein B0H17DRAFT_1091362 [Mycena rosella]
MSPAKTPQTSSEAPAFPPAAHTSPKALVTEQPAPAPAMSVGREITVTQGDAARIRGGCIPCPDGGCCFIIPLPCCC